ncbi:uncharacterized protein LOC113516352 [Galleria mellonella]|uniref:Uncharacterized protein LOC113516352 n=1 Tax=Galleria mellonella TaxID=7137 RepID=A0ABM3MZI2_GALME|nr:uncharacterized protein LOC113516352 [Galleria mellonella]
MNYKEYIQNLRKLTMSDACLLLNGDIIPNLKQYVSLLDNIKFEDGSYHAFYGEVKKIITSFLYYYTVTMDDMIIKADKYSHDTNKNDLLSLAKQTINIHECDQISFGKDFLPVQSPIEKQTYDEIQEKYNVFMNDIFLLRDVIEKLDKKEKVDNFALEHFKISVVMTSNVFKYTHDYILMMLGNRLPEIQVSLEEILLRMRNNQRSIESASSDNVNKLLNQLYDRNKEHLMLSRQFKMCSVEYAEVSRAIEVIREKIENSKYDIPLSRLSEEVAYWEERLREFHQIVDGLRKLKTEQTVLTKQEQIYQSMQTTELPGSKYQCWINMSENLKQRKEEVNRAINEAAKALITFFCVRGSDRIFYTDDVGPYYLDEYNHQVYFFDSGMGVYHFNCYGEFKETYDKEKYYFDENGRYVKNENEEKVYRCAPCTSSYNLAKDGLLIKVTKDCGHSEAINRKCKLTIKNPTDIEILPTSDEMDIKGKLDPETVKYLWDSFGHLLPDALHDVGRDHIKNPIQHLAHKLLFHKYNQTHNELREKKKEAELYRTNIYQERKDKAVIASKSWKAKQVKRRKPEESDDALNRSIFEAQVAAQDFVNNLNYFND